MAVRRTCPEGHQWDVRADVPAGETARCPVCQRPAQADPSEEATAQMLQPEDGTAASVPTPAPLPATSEPLPRVPGYEVIAEIGGGGMGVVYQARHRRLGLTVALKMVRGGRSHDLPRFAVEARAVAALHHPNVVRIYDCGEHAGVPYFSMEFVEGGSLADRLRRGPLTADDAAALVETLARTMDHVHQKGIVHRDLKPRNVLFRTPADPVIADFGLARFFHEDQALTAPGLVLGSVGYMAPEQACGTRPVGPTADVHALGAILYECLAGRPPFQGDNYLVTLVQVQLDEPDPPSRHHAGVPAELEAVCLKCLEKDPANRYATAGQLAEDLRRFRAGEPVSVEACSPLDWDVRWARRAGYELLELIACGRTGFLYKARQLCLNRVVTLKLLGPCDHSRFRRAAEAIARLHHTNIVQIFEFGERHGQTYFVMEYVEGGHLESHFLTRRATFAEAAALVATLARAMQYAHERGVVHCSLKPSSVLLTADGVPKVVRFGLARLLGEDTPENRRPNRSRRLATYLAPEQVADEGEVGPFTDVYGLGGILYRLLAGRPPYRGRTMQQTRQRVLTGQLRPLRSIRPDTPPPLEALCDRCLARESAARPTSARAVAVELERWLTAAASDQTELM